MRRRIRRCSGLSTSAYILVFGIWPAEGRASVVPVLIIILSSYLIAQRNLLISRTDQPAESQLDTYLLAPLCMLWSLLVLRPLRLYAMLTCAKTSWATRATVEIELAGPGTGGR